MAFAYEHGHLTCQGVDLEAVATQFGTPAYVYSEQSLRRNAQVLSDCFMERGFKISYAIKANSNPAFLHLFREYGFGMDIVSGGELQMAQHCDVPGSVINFAGVGKTQTELRSALAADIEHFNVESVFELAMLDRQAAVVGKTANVLLRLNPDIDPHTHPHISTGLKENKFGMRAELVQQILCDQRRYPHLKFDGIHCHIGSQVLNPQPFMDLLDYLEYFTAELKTAGVRIDHLDLGGGFGVNYKDPFEDILETTPYLENYAMTAVKKLGKYQLHIQPGRILVANAGVLLTRVLGSKKNGEHHFVVVDGASTDLIRPALYDAYHAVLPHLEKQPDGLRDVVGPVCESSDTLARQLPLGHMEEGELLVIGSAGAYGSSMGSTYNLRPLSPEILVTRDHELQLIRRRQQFEDLISLYM